MSEANEPTARLSYAEMEALYKEEYPFSEAWLKWMESDFTPEPIPPCRVCGAPMSPARMGGGEPTVWRCDKASEEVRSSEADLREAGWDHYRKSEFRQLKHGDERVLKLIAAYRRL